MTARNETAFRMKAAQGPDAAITSPPKAGPTALARVKPTLPSAIAEESSGFGTISGIDACHAGQLTAPPMLRKKDKRSSTPGVTPPVNARTPRRAAATSIQICVKMRILRRSRMSASAPAGSEKRNMGRVTAVSRSPTSAGEGVSVVISHPSPPSCIQVPMLETIEAIQSARKSGWLNGLSDAFQEEIFASGSLMEQNVGKLSHKTTPGVQAGSLP